MYSPRIAGWTPVDLYGDRNWVKDVPAQAGWYMWKKRTNQDDPWKWYAYFIDDDGAFWSNGTEEYPPTGGWWSIPIIYMENN